MTLLFWRPIEVPRRTAVISSSNVKLLSNFLKKYLGFQNNEEILKVLQIKQEDLDISAPTLNDNN